MEDQSTEAPFTGVVSAPAAVHRAAAGSFTVPSLNVETFGKKLARGKWFVLFTAAFFALLAMMLGEVQQPLYRVRTSIEVQSPDRNTLPVHDAAPSNESFLQTQIRIIESRSLVQRVLARLSDEDRAALLDTPHFWWSHAPDQPDELLIQRLSARTSGETADPTGIIDISFLSPDSAAGARFLNVLTQELMDFNIERSLRAVMHNRQWTDRQIEDLRHKWEQSAQVLAEYSQISGLALPAPVLQTEPVAKVPKAIDDMKLRQLRGQLAELNKQITQWQTLYGPSSATVQQLKAQASQTATAIRQYQAPHLMTQAASPVTSNVANVAATAQAIAHLNALQKEAESNRVIYETTAARLKAASVLTASQLGEISVVDPAIPTTKLATPGQLLTGTVGAFMGALLGIAFVALRDRFSRTFSEPAFLGHYLGLHVLGAIPIDRFPGDGKTYDSVNQEPALHLNFEADLQTAEAFRALRSSILLGAGRQDGPRRLVFSSPGASEGTTFVVGNLGAALASAQRRVLLVDGNLRSPGLHKVFGADNDRGLADLLCRQIGESSMKTRDVIRATQIPDLYLLSAGQAGTRAPEILSSVQLPQLIREFSKGFDLVLVDSAPLIPYADTRSLARAVDGVVLVVKAGFTNRGMALEARDAVSQDGSRILGAILTEWDNALSASA